MSIVKKVMMGIVPFLLSCQESPLPVSIIPQPSSVAVGSGQFTIAENTIIETDIDNPELLNIAQFLRDKLGAGKSFHPEILAVSTRNNVIRMQISQSSDSLGREGYNLTVNEDGVFLTANAPPGLFYGIQTMLQLLPPEVLKEDPDESITLTIPGLTIIDKPRFKWRGLNLDCGRHFMSKDFVKRYIDLLAIHKMNTLHWHLTEDQGWRIEIKKYPKLTSVGAWRTYEDGTVYGGFYTQDDIREVVDYARSRFINIVPEIEMPGHSVAALASYPEYSCLGEPLKVQTQWGVHKDVYCAGNEKTFAFLEDVLIEVMDLFPSKYIHIGGDECPKDRWQECAKCQRRIRREGLTDEYGLQSYFITRIEKFLNSYDRQIIGWDEILEGGLAPGATVQSWRGYEGGIAAAKSGHGVIMSPNGFTYFNADIANTDLRKAYSFEPVPPVLTPDEAQYIIGGEANMWSEHAPEELVDGKLFPRILALAEVLWTTKQNKNYDHFYNRVQNHYQRLDYLGVNYGPESKALSIYSVFKPQEKSLRVVLEAGEKDIILRYAIDDSKPDIRSEIYSDTLIFTESVKIRGQAFKNGKMFGLADSLQFVKHRALGLKPEMKYPYSYKYTAGGDLAMTDGLLGSLNFNDGHWQGYEGDDLDMLIDLGKVTEITNIRLSFLQDPTKWIFLPVNIKVSISEDGKHYNLLRELMHNVSQDRPDAIKKEFDVNASGQQLRYLRIYARSVGICPKWHPGAGGKAWIFSDEIIIN